MKEERRKIRVHNQLTEEVGEWTGIGQRMIDEYSKEVNRHKGKGE